MITLSKLATAGKAVLLMLAAGMFFARCGLCKDEIVPDEVRPAAQRWLDENRNAGDESSLDLPPGSLVNAVLADDVSFAPTEQEPPFPVHHVRRQAILKNKGNIAGAIRDTPDYFLYPVRSGSRIVGSVRVALRNNVYDAVSFGELTTTEFATEHRRALSAGQLDPEVRLIVIPSAAHQFVAHVRNGALTTVAWSGVTSLSLKSTPLDSQVARLMTIIALPDSVFR